MYRIILLVIFAAANAELHLNGTCDFKDIKGQPIVNLTVINKWYHIEKTDNNNEKGQCATTLVFDKNNTWIIANGEVVDKKLQYYNATVVAVRPDNLNAVIVKHNENETLSIIVLKSDFANYALLYACRDDTPSTKTVWGWKLGKTTKLSAEQLANMNTTGIAELNQAQWRTVSHSDESCIVNSAVSHQVSVISLIALLYTVTAFSKEI